MPVPREGPPRFGERPQVREHVARDAAPAVRDPDYDVLLGLADGDLDGRGRRLRLALGVGVGARLGVGVEDGRDRIPQQLADDVLQVAEDVGEGRVQVALDPDLGDGHVRPVGRPRQVPHRVPAPLDHVPGGALQEDLPDELGFRGRRAHLEPVRVEVLG